VTRPLTSILSSRATELGRHAAYWLVRLGPASSLVQCDDDDNWGGVHPTHPKAWMAEAKRSRINAFGTEY